VKPHIVALVSILLVLLPQAIRVTPAEAQPAAPSVMLSFENADIQTVIKAVSSLMGITFLYDPEQVRGKITLLSPKSISPAQALELLSSALALHGYGLVSRAEGVWIVPAVRIEPEAMAIEVVQLRYARAGEVAQTLSWIAPPGVRIVPYHPTNSLVISGPPASVEKLIDVIKPSSQN